MKTTTVTATQRPRHFKRKLKFSVLESATWTAGPSQSRRAAGADAKHDAVDGDPCSAGDAAENSSHHHYAAMDLRLADEFYSARWKVEFVNADRGNQLLS